MSLGKIFFHSISVEAVLTFIVIFVDNQGLILEGFLDISTYPSIHLRRNQSDINEVAMMSD